MILVDVEVPIMGKQYDFQIEDTAQLSEVLEEISEMICQKEQCLLIGTKEHLLLWDAEKHRQLDLSKTCQENQLLTGSRLMLC